MGYKSESYENQAKTIIKNLKKRNMIGYYCETGKEALDLVKSILPKGSLVTNGGSETLVETGIMDLIRSGEYEYIDRKSAKTPEESRALYGRIVTADYYLMSTNAITKEGELINVDGVGNRVACLINGPEHVLIITGMNKVVTTVEDGIRRVRNIAAPPNSIRVGSKTPCSVTGFCSDCQSDDCICSQTVITRRSMKPGRITVILVGEEYGF
ncbi:MAG TPA: lactate utilization protein [Candidatus Blautia pullistercoris]|uniref:Lactate utilization protein n=1 Tax=Candidatus Blautia pullistercoris TaxID=2838499 RepID=A0A9D2AN19_9FIRM|nr:lactate utilization protein [Candidatus Blautia pullistercoris]